MGLFNRFYTLLKADAHGIVDALEDRQLILNQCLRDAEAELNRKRDRISSLKADLKRVEKTSATAIEQRERADRDIALAQEHGEEEIARFTARRYLASNKTLHSLSERQERIQRELVELEKTIGEEQRTFEQCKEEAAEFMQRSEHDPVRADELISEHDVSLKLMRRNTEQRAS